MAAPTAQEISNKLEMFERDTTITPRKIRSIGLIPATIYGKHFEPMSIQVNAHDFQLMLQRGIRNFELNGCGKTIEAKVHQLQKVSTKEQVLHAEFLVTGK
ncbi:MAG: hypothetical protein KC476_05110 [Cyanobacteria bacterium HKST-UBA06]|nr:hypothetical protein [Cyanobacteria bacterium HKST-UBA05]MCA9798602.1 hypothetical protein [Cyanobacteria bacterium HKST-UBA04]MCA9807317.1 hypothetical protein [Cyanobacteria bacterium HKST-UBA06]MCA9842825.1 hypothetical protein [Cyanobacteria bacterium HKST-UBA03]